MKLQGMSIVYLLVVLPIFVVITMALSVYSSAMRTKIEYDKKVLTSAQDAIKAFEINTNAESYSKVSDVLRPAVEASINVFRDSLGTNLGMSNIARKKIDENFVIGLFTLYDGFYISMPTNEPVTINGSNGVAKHLEDDGVDSRIEEGSGKISNVTVDLTKEKESSTDVISEVAQDKSNLYKPVIFEKNTNSSSSSEVLNGTVNVMEAKTKINHLVKNISTYSARYNIPKKSSVHEGGSVLVNYTLDNFITLNGYFEKDSNVKQTFTKAGYLLNNNISIESAKLDFTNSYLNKDARENLEKKLKVLINPAQANDEIVDRYILELETYNVGIELTLKNPVIEKQSHLTSVVEDDNKVDKIVINYKPSGYQKPTDRSNKPIYYQDLEKYNTNTAYEKQQLNAIKYYMKATKFTYWMKENLGDITIENLDYTSINQLASTDLYSSLDIFSKSHKELYKNDKIFSSISILDQNSYFNVHRRMVIKNVILYNLFVSAINYNEQKYDGQPYYQLPQIKESSWDTILSNVAFTAFVEGFNVGSGRYNNYMTVGSTNNKYMVTDNNLAFVKDVDYNNQTGIYYPIKELYAGNIEVNNLFKDSSNRIIGMSENRFRNDGEYNKDLGLTVFDSKNYKYQTAESGIEENIDYTKTPEMKKHIILALAAEKEKLVKISKFNENSTISYGTITGESGTYKIDKKEIGLGYNVTAKMDTINVHNTGIKRDTYTYNVKLRDEYKENPPFRGRNPRIILTIKAYTKDDKLVDTIVKNTTVAKGGAYSIFTYENGLELDPTFPELNLTKVYENDINRIEVELSHDIEVFQYGQVLSAEQLKEYFEVDLVAIRREQY